MTEKKKKLSDIPIGIRAEEALKKAVAETIADHKRAGDPIVIWRDGEIVQIPPEQIEVREEGLRHHFWQSVKNESPYDLRKHRDQAYLSNPAEI